MPSDAVLVGIGALAGSLIAAASGILAVVREHRWRERQELAKERRMAYTRYLIAQQALRDKFAERDPEAVSHIHPAREWLAALGRLEQQMDELEAAQQQIEAGLKQECRAKPIALLNEARATFTSVETPVDAGTLTRKSTRCARRSLSRVIGTNAGQRRCSSP